jgi:hypothetical protein
MFDFLKFNKKNPANELPLMTDLENKPLKEGDIVESLRYDMGRSRVIMTDKGLSYQSLETGKIISWHYMVDAATSLQKVRRIDEPQINSGSQKPAV